MIGPDVPSVWVVTISAHGRLSQSPRQVYATAATALQTHHALRLQRFFDPALAQELASSASVGRQSSRVVPAVDGVAIVTEPELVRRLNALLNADPVLRIVEKIARLRRGSIAGFRGCIATRRRAAGHFSRWHDDIVSGEERVLALSVNLSHERYRGGALLIRKKSQPMRVRRYSNDQRGDALLFRVSKDVEHRVEAVRGAQSRTVFVGWFLGGG